MKAKYLILALSCMLMFACNSNNPDGGNNSQSMELINQLGGFAEGIGTIVNTQTLNDGTVVMTDDHGNSITRDNDRNVTIVTQEGEIIMIDNSINEDPTATKDKWYNTKWTGTGGKFSEIGAAANYSEVRGITFQQAYLQDNLQNFLNRLKDYGFQIVEQNYMSKDSSETNVVDGSMYNMSLKITTCAIQTTITQTEYTSHKKYNYVRYIVSPEIVFRNGEEYRYVIEVVPEVNITYYYHVIYKGEKAVDVYGCKDNVLNGLKDFQIIDSQEKLLSRSDTTIFYNYRRLNDTQLAVYNNSESYIFKENTNNTKPSMYMCDINGHELVYFGLSSF